MRPSVPGSDLSDGRHVDRMVQLSAPALGKPVDHPAARGKLDGCGSVVGGVGIAVGETADVTGVPDDCAAMIGPTP